MGIGYGSFVAVSPLVLADLFGVVGLGSLMGFFYTACGLGGLIGPPMAGRMIDVYGGYTMSIYVALGLGIISFLLLTIIPATPSGNISLSVNGAGETHRTDESVALAMLAFDETLMELEDWLDS